jgi:AraC-like DNA-binding protein
VRAGWSLVLDEATMHLTQQFTATLILGLCAATGRYRASPRSVRICPHPEFGLDHLRPWFGSLLGAAEEATLDIEIDDDVLDAGLSGGPRTGFTPAPDWVPLKGDGSFSSSVRLVMKAMANDPPVSIERLAGSAGMSARSFQRVLTCEGTSFRRLSDGLRRDRAMAVLPAGPGTLSSVAADLGYAAQSSLSRAVRRWTGVPPKEWMRPIAAQPDKKKA